MRTMNTSELSGSALDWAVAKCEEKHVVAAERLDGIVLKDTSYEKYSPSSDWLLAGPIIERENIGLNEDTGEWYGDICPDRGGDHIVTIGPTPLIAAMRCYVASKLGDTIEIPDVLGDE